MAKDRPFQRLDDRLAGLPIDETLHAGVPRWLEKPLRQWLASAVRDQDDVARRVVMRLRWSPKPQQNYISTLLNSDTDTLLTVVDAVLQLHPGWQWPPYDGGWGVTENRSMEHFVYLLTTLDQILVDGASTCRVDLDGRRLIRRVNETVQESVDQAIAAAPETAADHLRTAWIAAYGLEPDPDKVFNEVMRAVEEIACPLVEHRKAESGKATLGTVIGELDKNASHKWELALPGEDGNPRSVEHLVGMMRMLWQAQVSRHGGAPKSRRQDQEEAEAAVHLAALLVHWLSTGVLRPA